MAESTREKAYTSARSWTSFQFVLFKGALIALAVATARLEFASQEQGHIANVSRYLLVTFLIFLLAVTFYLERWFNTQEDHRKETEIFLQKMGELQSAAISYLFEAVLPGAETEEVLDIIERFPSILGMLSIQTVKQQVGESYKMVVDAVSNVHAAIGNIKQEIMDEVTDHVKPILEVFESITSVPKPKTKKQELEESLLPKEMR